MDRTVSFSRIALLAALIVFVLALAGVAIAGLNPILLGLALLTLGLLV